MTLPEFMFRDSLKQSNCEFKDPVCAGFTRCGKLNRNKSSAQCEILCATGGCPIVKQQEQHQ
jgi:hypothetical protein